MRLGLTYSFSLFQWMMKGDVGRWDFQSSFRSTFARTIGRASRAPAQSGGTRRQVQNPGYQRMESGGSWDLVTPFGTQLITRSGYPVRAP